MAFLSRLPHVDRDAFKAYYETKHAPLIQTLLPSIETYERNYPDVSKVRPAPGQSLDEAVGFDVVTVFRFSGAEGFDAFKRAMRDPQIAEAIERDEANFLDRAKSRLFVVDERVSA
jgi:hypothetical protein